MLPRFLSYDGGHDRSSPVEGAASGSCSVTCRFPPPLHRSPLAYPILPWNNTQTPGINYLPSPLPSRFPGPSHFSVPSHWQYLHRHGLSGRRADPSPRWIAPIAGRDRAMPPDSFGHSGRGFGSWWSTIATYRGGGSGRGPTRAIGRGSDCEGRERPWRREEEKIQGSRARTPPAEPAYRTYPTTQPESGPQGSGEGLAERADPATTAEVRSKWE